MIVSINSACMFDTCMVNVFRIQIDATHPPMHPFMHPSIHPVTLTCGGGDSHLPSVFIFGANKLSREEDILVAGLITANPDGRAC